MEKKKSYDNKKKAQCSPAGVCFLLRAAAKEDSLQVSLPQM